MSNDGVSDADDVAIARTHTTESQGLSRTDRPAIVLVATRDNEAALARAILYARHRGHDVLVGHADIPDADSVTFARQLDVPTFGPTRGDPDPSALVRELASTARERGYPAAITRPPSCPRIDFDATLDRLDEGGYAVEGVVAERSTETSVLVGIPAHNEAATIDDVVDGATEYADEVLVVDDGSTDGTATRARAAGATVREHETNRGYGAALRTLFTAASDRSVDHLVVVDGDGQHEPEEISRLLETQRESDAEIVIGSRFKTGSSADVPLYRRFGIGVINSLLNVSLGTVTASQRISDTQSGFRAYSTAAVDSLAADESIGTGMDASTDILYHAFDRDYEIREVGTTVYHDVEDSNSYHPVRHGLSLVHSILTTVERRHPILALGVPGAASILAGVGVAFWALERYLAWGTLPVGLSLLSVLLFLVGTFSCFTAIVLHALQNQKST